MASSELPSAARPASVTRLGLLLRISGAGVVISAGVGLAWPFRTFSRDGDAPTVAALARENQEPAPVPVAAQAVFQAPGQAAPVKVVRSPKRVPPPDKVTRPPEPPPEALPPAKLAAEPPELPTQFTMLEQVAKLEASFGKTKEAPRSETRREHRLVDGDTLERLAQRYLGDRQRWPEIQAENFAVLRDPRVLPIGKTIRLPPRDLPTVNRQTSESAIKPLPTAIISEPRSPGAP